MQHSPKYFTEQGMCIWCLSAGFQSCLAAVLVRGLQSSSIPFCSSCSSNCRKQTPISELKADRVCHLHASHPCHMSTCMPCKVSKPRHLLDVPRDGTGVDIVALLSRLVKGEAAVTG